MSIRRLHMQSVGEMDRLVTSWVRSLRAANLGERTVQSYEEGVLQLHAFLAERGMPTAVGAIRREHVEAWVELLLQKRKPSTVLNRYKSAQQFFKWAVDDGELERSPMERMRPPKVPELPVPILPEVGAPFLPLPLPRSAPLSP